MSLVVPTEHTVASLEANRPQPATARIHYLDNLRALAMLLGIFLHAGLAYANPAQSIWLATDPSSSVAVDVAIWFIHLFRMALFFLISGYFATLVIERKGVKRFLWGRTVRIVFPFLLFYPFLLIAMTVCIVFALSYVKEPAGLLLVIDRATKLPSAAGQSAAADHHAFVVSLLPFHVQHSVCGNGIDSTKVLSEVRCWILDLDRRSSFLSSRSSGRGRSHGCP